MRLILRKSVFPIVILSLLAACTKDRPIMEMPDPNGDRMKKATFIADDGKPKMWLSRVTVTKTSSNAGFLFTGVQSDSKAGYFEFTRDKLKFYDASQPYQGKKDSSTLPTLINEWSITHTEKRLSEADGKVMNREEENNYINWKEKRFFTLDWAAANISESATFPYHVDIASTFECWAKKSSHLVDGSREISDDYIGFTVAVDYQQNSLCSGSLRRHSQADFTYTVHYKYSFMKLDLKATQAYQPYLMAGEKDPLNSKYGYFQTLRQSFAEDGRFKNQFYVNRWDPNKTHTYYFAQNFPEQWKPIFYKVIDQTNQLFAANKLNNYNPKDKSCTTGLCFVLKENDGTKEFGDLRYSFFKVVEELVEPSPFGYGPSSANPFTGEIISANTVIWTGTLKYYLDIVAEQLEHDLGGSKSSKWETSSLFKVLKKTLSNTPHTQWTSTSELLEPGTQSGDAFKYLLSKNTFAVPQYNAFTWSGRSHSTHEDSEHGRGGNSLIDLSSIKTVQDTLGQVNFRAAEDGGEVIEQAIESAQSALNRSFSLHDRDTVVMPMMEVVASAAQMVASGVSREEAVQSIMHSVALHEFGHNLGLRHNFYGSVDKENFARVGGQTIPTNSVMDYLSLKDEAGAKWDWMKYDHAALAYSYSSGKVDLSKAWKTHLLYCTDQHVPYNFMCNKHDRGASPTEVALSKIETYEEMYRLRNLRRDRAFWDTRDYEETAFETMFDMKKNLMMWRAAFSDEIIRDQLPKYAKMSTSQTDEVVEDIEKELKQSIRLSIAFYNAVLQQSSADRDWQTEYDSWSGSVERIGILWDKVYAMMFLMGDTPFTYNPNKSIGKATYLYYLDEFEFREEVEKVLENALTVRVEMEPWFISMARALYGVNASNYYNVNRGDLIEKVRFQCFTPQTLKERFGIDPDAYVAEGHNHADQLTTSTLDPTVLAGKVEHPYFRERGERIGVVPIQGNYYLALEHKNSYAYALAKYIEEKVKEYDNSQGTYKEDVKELYRLYNLMTKSVVPERCE